MLTASLFLNKSLMVLFESDFLDTFYFLLGNRETRLTNTIEYFAGLIEKGIV